MKFVDEYRDPALVKALAQRIAAVTTKPWTLMEVCGGQTHAIVRYGLDQLLPAQIELIHGPGCPVCVTDSGIIDEAIAIAREPNTILCSFGDMLRVPGSGASLLQAKAQGADVRVVYSPLDALALARAEPQRKIVFFAVGFETTAPANALTVYRAAQEKIDNFSLLMSQVLVPPAFEKILQQSDNRVQAFLAAGHVCTVMGTAEYEPIARGYGVPIVVTGFEPVDILQGILLCIEQLEQGRAEVEIQYLRSVNAQGNLQAQQLICEIFQRCDRRWRGMGELSSSGLVLRERYRKFDARERFAITISALKNAMDCDSRCRSGDVLIGRCKPHECAEFGSACTPEHPIGAPMVSSEGACAAYYLYREKGRYQKNSSDPIRAVEIQ